MSQWVARNFILDRDGLRLSVSLGEVNDGFKKPTWCWFIYQRMNGFWLTIIAQGTADLLEEAQLRANEWVDRHIGVP